jgi:alpha-glucosidase
MIFRRKLIILLSVVALGWSCTPAKDSGTGPLAVSSPDGSLTIALSLEAKPQPYAPGKRAYYRVTFKGAPVLADSPLGLDFQGAEPLERDFEVVTTEERTHDSTWENAFGALHTVPDRYNELTVSLREKLAPGRRVDIVFRAYDEGVAFRYVLPKQDAMGDFTLAAENTGFYFPADASAYALNMGRFNTHNEGEYARTALRAIKPASIINLPLLVEMPGGIWAALLEADLTDYSGMYVGGVPGIPNALVCKLSSPPRRKADEAVVGTTPKATPWRVLMIASTPARLIETNYLVLNLSAPCAIADTAWIKPGKAAWDWWSGSYATGVRFKPGMNTATMKHYIDFAAAHKFE